MLIFILIKCFDESFVSKQNSPRWDATFCGVTSEACPIKQPKRVKCANSSQFLSHNFFHLDFHFFLLFFYLLVLVTCIL